MPGLSRAWRRAMTEASTTPPPRPPVHTLHPLRQATAWHGEGWQWRCRWPCFAQRTKRANEQRPWFARSSLCSIGRCVKSEPMYQLALRPAGKASERTKARQSTCPFLGQSQSCKASERTKAATVIVRSLGLSSGRDDPLFFRNRDRVTRSSTCRSTLRCSRRSTAVTPGRSFREGQVFGKENSAGYNTVCIDTNLFPRIPMPISSHESI